MSTLADAPDASKALSRKNRRRNGLKHSKTPSAATTRVDAIPQGIASSQTDPVHPTPALEVPKVEPSIPSKSAVPPEASGSKSTPFDPKSILPTIKPKKDLSRLGASSSSNKQAAAFNCIDGTVRTADPRVPAPSASIPSLRFDEYISRPVQDDNGSEPGDQFTAFGVKAYPTRACYNDICYDFVMPNRRCRLGSRCKRIHPLDKKAHKNAAKLEGRLFADMKAQSSNDAGLSADEADDESGERNARNRAKRPSGKTSKTDEGHYGVRGSNSKRHESSSDVSSDAWWPSADWSDWDNHDSNDWDSFTDASSVHLGTGGNKSTSPQTGASTSDKGKGKEIVAAAPEVKPVEAAAPLHSNGKGKEKATLVHPLPPKPVLVQPSVATKAPNHHNSSASTSSPASTRTPIRNEPVGTQHLPPRPQNAAQCKQWALGRCNRGYGCKYVHGDLEYNDPEPDVQAAIPEPPKKVEHIIHDCIKLHIGCGFDIEKIEPGFESTIICIGNLPVKVTEDEVKVYMERFGQVEHVRKPSKPVSPMVMRVDYLEAYDAYRAWACLHGTMAFGRKLDVRLVLPQRKVETGIYDNVVRDNVVRLDWEYPHRVGFIGFKTLAEAEAAVEKARHTLYAGLYQTEANLHMGTPAVGRHTVMFTHLPANATAEGMNVFGPHDHGLVTRMPNYRVMYIRHIVTMEENIANIQQLCTKFKNTMTKLEFRPGPHREGKARGWATFTTAAEAERAAKFLHNKYVDSLAHIRLRANNFKTISYRVSSEKYPLIRPDLEALDNICLQEYHYNCLTTVDKGSFFHITLGSINMEHLQKFREQIEPLVNGQLVMTKTGEIAWDNYFASPHARGFLNDMHNQFRTNLIQVDHARRTIRIFGDPTYYPFLHRRILERLDEVPSYRWHSIPLDGRLATAFSAGPIDKLVAKMGSDMVYLNGYTRELRVCGEENYVTAAALVTQVRDQLPDGSAVKKPLHECPVCLEEAAPPTKLACGHAFCRSCLKSYLNASIEQKNFPLRCLGAGGTCTQRIPLKEAKWLLPLDTYNAIVEAAFRTYIQKRANSFRFCPTPNCNQIYRVVPPNLRGGMGAGVKCPSCHAETCAQCNQPDHPGISCKAASHSEKFKGWAKENGAKQCPGCKMSVEKVSGCNHMQCTQCKTHFCWICGEMSTLADIYSHMNKKHGGIGLDPATQNQPPLPVEDDIIWWDMDF